ncbi:MAG: DEAD/DEAH box helicase family protein [Lachnospiraceae bacterium]|nr:DEAD/DEAH box helicase family protein [Lachnospiraceae bacterium]
MAVALYQHNQTAYEAAAAMIESTKKAAVIHPTGTGRSFIALKLCEAHPEETVCWLAPSEHIYRTQLENWIRAGGEELSNICFYTYVQLMTMGKEEFKHGNF